MAKIPALNAFDLSSVNEFLQQQFARVVLACKAYEAGNTSLDEFTRTVGIYADSAAQQIIETATDEMFAAGACIWDHDHTAHPALCETNN